MDKNIENIVNEIKQIDNNVTTILVPILQDTIKDYKKINSRLIAVIILLILAISAISIYSQITISKQTDKYNEFLSQFEFESDEYTYTQEQNTLDGDSVINGGININQP